MTDTELWTFQEIAFKAEMDRHDDPESEEEAFILCAEDPATRTRNIVELRNMIYERGECHPPRMDDAFLLRFLRARRSVPARAHRLLVRYCNFRDQNPHLWRDIDWFGLTKLGHVFEGVLFDRPDVGRLIICRLGQWDPDDYPVDDLIRGCLLLLEIGIMQPKLQVLGGTALLDCEGLTMKHMRQFSPAIALQAMNVMGFAFPLHQRGVHVVNCSRVFETLFHFFKRLAPVDDLWKRVRFHGNDLSSLHKYIAPDCLPKRYGGHRQEVSLEKWLTKIKQYKNKNFDNDMRTLGYAVD
ncbi:alpha-tocopherol transfer protein-like [Spodoptera litura]|uniref:Alpha-tocopherol transfer protein-like n=1 Tax=Spodoptera litura TaxID=69820 RepID=A0A9J7IT48_SPOLT|nr:alpha-tocopherol transfer protein-like [Spodoptera litura]